MAVLTVLAVAYVAVYAAGVRWWPFMSCRRCEGSGKLRSPSGKAWRRCPRCRGTGRRLRLGRRVLNAVSKRARKAEV